MATLMSSLLALLKWPTAVAVAILTPAGAFAFWRLLEEAWERETWTTSFGIGFLSASAAWLVFGRLRIVRFWCTLEHELTHALFAWLTFVPVIELRSSDGSVLGAGQTEGHVRLQGGNWLIDIAPYFFPTASAALLLATWLLAAQPTQLARGLLGAATAYSMVSTWQETHWNQIDLRRVSHLFSWLFLPGANLLGYGMLLANELGGPTRALRFPLESFDVTRTWLSP